MNTDRYAERLAPSSAARLTLDPRAQARYLLGEWRAMLDRSTILADFIAGTSVALVALPLSLAIANASGVPPEVGLITAIVGGAVVALFGGCRLQVSGPAAAMTFLVYEILSRHGMSGLIATTLLAGLFQILAGGFRLGRFIQFIPRPVIAGFLTGIGLTILCTQLAVVLGVEVSHDEEGGAAGLLWQTLRSAGQAEPASMAIGATALVLMLVLPKINRRLPTPLIAVAAASILPIVLGWDHVKLLGALPSRFPLPGIPAVPWDVWNEIVQAALTVFLLASIESLLSASVVDSLDRSTRVDNDQELFGQGLANAASACFGGIPVTGVIARSATNIQSGARTRLASIIHTGWLLACVFGLGAIVGRIPLAALAGVLMAVALRMIEVRLLRVLIRSSRPEALVYLATVLGILATDLIDGVQIGMVATVLYFVSQMSRLNLRPLTLGNGGGADAANAPGVLVLDVEGPLFFASGFHLRNLRGWLQDQKAVVLDLRLVPFLDITGAEILNEQAEMLRKRGIELILARPNADLRQRLEMLDGPEFEAIQRCPIFETIEQALEHAASVNAPADALAVPVAN